jgi:hypothetical protein
MSTLRGRFKTTTQSQLARPHSDAAQRHEGQSDTEPKNVVNRHVPERLLRDATQDDRAQWHQRLQGAIPRAHTDPGDGKEKIGELKFINMGPSRYDCHVTIAERRQAYVPL